MKLTVTSGDGLGDFILRLPWLLAMIRHGWRLQVVVRESTAELARLAGLDADIVTLRQSPYSKEVRRQRRPFRREFEAVRKFGPDILFFGPSQPCFLEEQTARNFRDVRQGGFWMEGGFWPGEGLTEPRDFARNHHFRVAIEFSDNETLRNAKAAEFFLGAQAAFELVPFRFSAEALDLPPAKTAQPYLACSPGYREGDYFQGWGSANWSRELALLAKSTDRDFVFVGADSEVVSNQSIFAGLGSSRRYKNLTGKLRTLRELLGVLAGAEACVVKDSGPMHLAAALGKPLIAVFGGGTWPRFFPEGSPAVALTSSVPCRACDWRCHLSEPACVTGLPAGCLTEAWGLLQTLRAPQVRILEYSPRPEVAALLRPADGYPARQHGLRRERLREERKRLMRPWWRKWFNASAQCVYA